MSFVTTQPEMLASAIENLQGVRGDADRDTQRDAASKSGCS
jgi:hypothetical protein